MATKAKTTAKAGATSVAKGKRVLQPKEYRLLKYQPLTFELKTGRDGNLVIFDETEGTNRAIRHCKNEKTIFVEDQSKNAVVSNIIFLNGFLFTEAKETITQDFLDNHPSNGVLFEVIDDAADAKEMVDVEELILDIKQAIRAKAKEPNGEETLRILVSVINSDPSGASEMEIDELKNELYDAVNVNPMRFCNEEGEITVFDDSDITRMAIAQQAFLSGVIAVSADSRRVIWGDTKATICNIPLGKNATQYFSNFLETEEGMTVMREIDKRS